MTQKQYNISDLLANSVQEFEDLDEETLDAIGRNIGSGALVVPVVITPSGVLVDGHQRLKVLLEQGRTVISAADVRFVDESKGALEWSVILNTQRRHLSTEQKATKAKQFRDKYHWSNAKIAELFGVSPQAVGQWLKGEPAPDLIIGKDGVLQPSKVEGRAPQAKSESPKADKPHINPWQGDGPVLRAVVRLTRDLDTMIPDKDGLPGNLPLPRRSELGDNQFEFCELELKELGEAVKAVLSEMAKPEPETAQAKPKQVSKKATPSS